MSFYLSDWYCPVFIRGRQVHCCMDMCWCWCDRDALVVMEMEEKLYLGSKQDLDVSFLTIVFS